MLKRIVSIIATVFIVILSVMPIIGASDEVYSFIPDQDGTNVYKILTLNEEFPDYVIKGYIISNIQSVGGEQNGFLRTYLDDPSNFDGVFSVPLYDGQSQLIFTGQQGDDVSCTLHITNQNNGLHGIYSVFGFIPTTSDFTLIGTYDGNIMYVIYDYATGIVTSSGIFNVPLYGNIYLYSQLPGSSSYDEGYADGYFDGLSAGEDIGYTEGYKDGQLATYDEKLVYDKGYNDGFAEGKAEGLSEGIGLGTAQAQEAYNKGVGDGQMQAGIVSQAIDGFFNAILGFFRPFLSIGIGSLTLYSLLGVLIVVGVVVLIVKITRG